MKAINVPPDFPIPFAANATSPYINAIPETTAATPGGATLNLGFPPTNFSPVGQWPEGSDFNGILNQITLWNQWQESGGPVGYDSGFSAAIGGYPKGAVLQSATLGGFWFSTADDNTTDPDTGGANWVAFTPLPLSAVDTGTANAAVIVLPYAITSYAQIQGLPITVKKIASQNTTAMTLAITGASGGAKAIKTPSIAALVSGNLPASGYFTVVYDGVQFQVVTPLVTTAAINTVIRSQKTGFIATGHAASSPSNNGYVSTTAGTVADSTNTVGITSAVTLACQASVSGAGGLDSASTLQNNHWYAVYVISGTSGVALIATDSTGLTTLPVPVLPSGYTYYRYICSFLTYTDYNAPAAGNIQVVPFQQTSDGTVWWTYSMQDVFIWQMTSYIGAPWGWTSSNLFALSVPPCIRPRVITRAQLTYPYAGPYGSGAGGYLAGPYSGGVVGIFSPDYEYTSGYFGAPPGSMIPSSPIGSVSGSYSPGFDLSNSAAWLGEGNPGGIATYGQTSGYLSFGYSSGPAGTQELFANASSQIGVNVAVVATTASSAFVTANSRLPVGVAIWTRGYVDTAGRNS